MIQVETGNFPDYGTLVTSVCLKCKSIFAHLLIEKDVICQRCISKTIPKQSKIKKTNIK